ncbi:adenine deaminase [[Eubacterium] cellulosolvens]
MATEDPAGRSFEMPFFFQTATTREDLVSVALGSEKADMTIENGTIVNVATSELYQADLAVKGERIAIVGDVEHTKGDFTEVLDARGRYLVPGLIDAHFHIESTMVSPSEFSRIVLPRGNTTVVVDPSWTANVMGMEGIRLLLDQIKRCRLRILLDAPSCVPLAPHALMTAGNDLGVQEIEEVLAWPSVVALGEMNDFKRVLDRDYRVHAEIRAAMRARRITNGNAPQMMGKELAAYIAAGMQSDHEAVTLEEGSERLRAGIRLVIRQGSSENNLRELIGTITKKKLDHHHCCFCTDDKNVLDLVRDGLIDNSVRLAIKEGVDPVVAVQIATLNAAEHVGIDREVGSLSPGKISDILLVEDLSQFSPELVIAGGTIVARNGRMIAAPERERYPIEIRKTIRVKRSISQDDLKCPTEASGRTKVWVIKVFDGQIASEAVKHDLPVRAKEILPDTSRDVIKAVVVERYGRTPPNIGKGFVNGFGLTSGAIATSVSADSHHLTSIGTSDTEIAVALNHLIQIQGGVVIAENGVIIAELHLPILGLISDEEYEKVARRLNSLNQAARRLGCSLSSPFMVLSFLANPAIPELRLSDKGLVRMCAEIIPLESS